MRRVSTSLCREESGSRLPPLTSQAQYPIGKRTWFRPAAAISAKSASVIHCHSNAYHKIAENHRREGMRRSHGSDGYSPRKGRAHSIPMFPKRVFGVCPRLELAESPFVYNVVPTGVFEETGSDPGLCNQFRQTSHPELPRETIEEREKKNAYLCTDRSRGKTRSSVYFRRCRTIGDGTNL